MRPRIVGVIAGPVAMAAGAATTGVAMVWVVAIGAAMGAAA